MKLLATMIGLLALVALFILVVLLAPPSFLLGWAAVFGFYVLVIGWLLYTRKLGWWKLSNT